VFIYWVVEGSPLLGVANMVPVLVTVALVAGSMRYFGIALNAITATILAITIGLGVDYPSTSPTGSPTSASATTWSRRWT